MKHIKTIMASLMLAALLTSCDKASNSNAAQPSATDTTAVAEDNAVIDNIMARRSIRKYQDKTVGRQILTKIMECGINAPNGQNKQSWEVRVVDKPEVMAQIKDIMAKANPDKEAEKITGCFRNAPVMVFIARDKGYDFSAYDCGLMAQNIMLSATSLGIGSICLGSPVRIINDNPQCAPVLEKLNFSEGYELCLCVGLGYADEAPEAKPRDMGKVKFVD